MSRIFSGIFSTYETASVLITRVSKMKSVPFAQMSRIRKLPFYSESAAVPGKFLVGWDPANDSLPIQMEEPGVMRGSLRKCVVVRAFLARSTTPSCSLL